MSGNPRPLAISQRRREYQTHSWFAAIKLATSTLNIYADCHQVRQGIANQECNHRTGRRDHAIQRARIQHAQDALCMLSKVDVIWAAVSRQFTPRISALGVSGFKTLDQIISTTADCV